MTWDDDTPSASVPEYDPLRDPAATAALGSALVARLDGIACGAVVTWNAPESAVLAYVVASSLGVPGYRVWDENGLIRSSGSLSGEPPCAIVLDAVRDASRLKALTAAVEAEGASVSAVVVLLDTSEAHALSHHVVSLRELPPEGGWG